MITILISRSQSTGEFEAYSIVFGMLQKVTINAYGKSIPEALDNFFEKWAETFTDYLTDENLTSCYHCGASSNYVRKDSHLHCSHCDKIIDIKKSLNWNWKGQHKFW